MANFLDKSGLTYLWGKIAAKFALKSDVPTKTSDLTNDSGFIAAHQDISGKKNVQTAVSDPTASGTGIAFIDSISQNDQGVITPTKKTVRDATTTQSGIVQLLDSTASTDTTKAATPNSVKQAYDLASGKAAPSTALSLTLASGSWSSATPSTQTITATGVTASNNIIVGAGSLTAAQREEMIAAQIACTAQGNGTITLTAYGEVPTSNLPIVVFILG